VIYEFSIFKQNDVIGIVYFLFYFIIFIFLSRETNGGVFPVDESHLHIRSFLFPSFLVDSMATI